MVPNIRLSNNFMLHELCYSRTANRHSIPNVPGQVGINKLKLLATQILQPIRNHFAIPIPKVYISAYRSIRLNRFIGSKDTSQHIKCEAIDVEIPGVTNWEVARWIEDNLDFDQLILEYVEADIPNSGWVHISYVPNNNRNEILTINKKGARYGLNP